MKIIKILKILGVALMLSAFIIVPESEPWYYELLLFNLGLALVCIPKLWMRAHS
ncbi:hypothetical protein [Spongiimicrobium salis]|uniref:hypothetical protein n=1 Tax=Spongiimicrobium salis TaxID=1667022 RepID=UPI00374CB206